MSEASTAAFCTPRQVRAVSRPRSADAFSREAAALLHSSEPKAAKPTVFSHLNVHGSNNVQTFFVAP